MDIQASSDVGMAMSFGYPDAGMWPIGSSPEGGGHDVLRLTRVQCDPQSVDVHASLGANPPPTSTEQTSSKVPAGEAPSWLSPTHAEGRSASSHDLPSGLTAISPPLV